MSENSHQIVATFANFASDVLAESDVRPVLIDFWAPWCGPCQTLLPILDRLADDFAGRFLLAKVNTDEEQQIAGHFGIRSLPTVMLVHRREIVDQFVGVQPERVYREALDRLVAGAVEAEPEVATEVAASGDEVSALEAAITERPRDPALLVRLAERHLRERDADAATDAIDRLAALDSGHAGLRGLRARHALTTTAVQSPDVTALRATLERDPRDPAARHALAAHHALAGDFATALAEWLEIVRTDRRFGDDAARRSMIAVFDILGDSHELVLAYRRKMANLLH